MLSNFYKEMYAILAPIPKSKIEKMIRGMQSNFFEDRDANGNLTTEDWEDTFDIHKKLNSISFQYSLSHPTFMAIWKKTHSEFYEDENVITIKSISIVTAYLFANDLNY
jgi:hypothetical protein